MTFDDFIYSFLLLISLAFGVICSNTSVRYRKYLMSTFGLLFVICSCGTAFCHSIIVSLACIYLMCIRPKNFQIFVFVFCFGYLAFFRTIHLFGFQKPPSYANAVQLVLTLKLIGAAFEISDSLERDKTLKNMLSSTETTDSDLVNKLRLELKYTNVKATFVDLFTYSYCFIGLLTGPYFKYRVYLDCVNSQTNVHIERSKLLWKRTPLAIGVGLSYLVTSHFFYIEYAKTDEFFELPFLYRLLFMTMMFFVFRMRMYFAWVVSECVCICASLGAYPAASKPLPGRGPTEFSALNDEHNESDISFETTRNLSIVGCEWAPTVREGMRSWNMSVQYWLATFVYRRFPIKSCRTVVTMLVSAFWHGVHPGYYLSFMTIPLSLHGEACLDRLLGSSKKSEQRPNLEQWRPRHLLDWTVFVHWFYKMRVYDYCCMGFLLLEASDTLRYWSSVWFSVHLMMLVPISLVALLGRARL